MALPEAHPDFRAHFSDPVYDSEGTDEAPFGNDEGWELVMDWGARRDELLPDGRIATIFGTEDILTFAGPMVGVDGLDTAQNVVGAGFTVLRLTGRITEEDRAATLLAIGFMIEMTPEDGRAIREQVRDDLMSWRNPT